MRGLLRIVAGGFVLFMALAVVQEWDFFRSAWFAEAPAAEPEDDERLGPAVEAVRGTLALMRHLYTSGGDARFAERMPASEAMIREMMDDIKYLHRNGRVQDPLLRSIEFRDVASLDASHVEVRTRELWEIRSSWLRDGSVSDPPQVAVVHALYRVRRSPSGWRVESWDWAAPEPAVGDGEPS